MILQKFGDEDEESQEEQVEGINYKLQKREEVDNIMDELQVENIILFHYHLRN